MARYLIAAGGVAYAAFAALVWTKYPGSLLPYLVFNVSMAALVALVFPRPRLHGYTVLVAFLMLGYWAKALVHTLWQLEFLEPVGAFSGTAAQWDDALLAMSASALGLAAVRGIYLWLSRGQEQPVSAVPEWFIRHRRLVWAATLAALFAVNAANLVFAFYQIGVNTKLVLPLRLHVVLAWLVNVGFALWIAALAWWEYTSGRRLAVAMGFVEAAVSSVSAFSRLLFLVHALAYWLVLVERRAAQAVGGLRLAALTGLFLAFFFASVLAVFALRASYYPDNAGVAHNLRVELPQLVLRRWTGLEGVLTASAAPDRGLDLMQRMVLDSPKGGAESLYQRAARSRFRADPTGTFTFGTNAGPAALLSFSGSLLAVFAGMAALMLLLAATEHAARRWTGNEFFVAVGAAALANVVNQTTFFYLTAVFLAQLWVAIAALSFISRRR